MSDRFEPESKISPLFWTMSHRYPAEERSATARSEHHPEHPALSAA